MIYQPTFLVSSEVRIGRLVSITLDLPAVEFPGVFALYPPDRRPPVKVRAFIDFAVQRFSPAPPWERF